MFIALIASFALGQTPGLPEGLEREYTARNAATDAQLDILTLPNEAQACTFYVWDNCGVSKESFGALNYTINAVLNARPRLIFPIKVAGGRLLRYNLYDFADYRDFVKLQKAFNKLADLDPVFHEPAAAPQVKATWHYVPPYLATDGKWYDYVADTVVTKDKQQAAIGAGGAGPLLLLSELTGLRQPILAADWMIPTFWSAIKIDGIQGQYYQLRGIQVGGDPKKGQKTDFDAFLIQFGVDPKEFRNLPSEQRTVMKSIVAKRMRQIEITPQNTVPPYNGPGILSATHDITNLEDDPAKDPLENLIAFIDAAREIIASLPCGLHAYLLTNGDGLAQNEVPPTVATWPHSPHGDSGGGTLQLVPGISCLECHGPNRGWNPTKNLVRELKADGFAARYDFRVGKLSAKEFMDLVSDLYDGEIDLPLKTAGVGYALAADRVTVGAWGLKSIEGVSAEIFRIYASYFREVDTAKALDELGYRWTGKSEFDLTEAFNRLIPRQEDDPARLGLLRISRPITRLQWNQIYFELALRDRRQNPDGPPAAAPRFRPGAEGKIGIMRKPWVEDDDPTGAKAHYAEMQKILHPPEEPRKVVAKKPGKVELGQFKKTAEDRRPHEATVAKFSADAGLVEIQVSEGTGLEIWGKPYSRVIAWGNDIGGLGYGGYLKFRTDRLMKPGDVWKDYRFEVDGEKFLVDLRPDRRVAVIVKRGQL